MTELFVDETARLRDVHLPRLEGMSWRGPSLVENAPEKVHGVSDVRRGELMKAARHSAYPKLEVDLRARRAGLQRIAQENDFIGISTKGFLAEDGKPRAPSREDLRRVERRGRLDDEGVQSARGDQFLRVRVRPGFVEAGGLFSFDRIGVCECRDDAALSGRTRGARAEPTEVKIASDRTFWN